MHEEKKEPKRKGRKGNAVALIAVLVALALAAALVILVMQYYQLTDSLADRQSNTQVTETRETKEEPETEASVTEPETDQEETTQTETKPGTEVLGDHPEEGAGNEYLEPAPEEGTGNDHPDPSPVAGTLENHPESVLESETAAGPETESETASSSVETAAPNAPLPAAQPAYQATDLTIADIPNSLYEQFQDPEELRSALFDWLTQNGFTEALDCTCSYEYEEDGELLKFTLQFSGFAVEATYSTSSNQYSFVLI